MNKVVDIDERMMQKAHEKMVGLMEPESAPIIRSNVLNHGPASKVTLDAVRKLLEDFPHPIIDDSIHEFSVALRYATAGVIDGKIIDDGFDFHEKGPEKSATPLQVKKEAVKLSEQIGKLAAKMEEMNDDQTDLDNHLFEFAFNTRPKGPKSLITPGLPVLDSDITPDYDRMRDCVREMSWLAGWLKRASAVEYSQADNKTLPAQMRHRFFMYGMRWALSFNIGFGLPISFQDAGGWPQGDWPTFFEGMCKLALGCNAPPDYLRLMKDIRKQFREKSPQVLELLGRGAKTE